MAELSPARSHRLRPAARELGAARVRRGLGRAAWPGHCEQQDVSQDPESVMTLGVALSERSEAPGGREGIGARGAPAGEGQRPAGDSSAPCCAQSPARAPPGRGPARRAPKAPPLRSPVPASPEPHAHGAGALPGPSPRPSASSPRGPSPPRSRPPSGCALCGPSARPPASRRRCCSEAPRRWLPADLWITSPLRNLFRWPGRFPLSKGRPVRF